ncbi:MAG: T9SS type A sorting domain-containing protein [Flavobacteriales bacterium]|nr:T9SS type A sorting domain-containing protein [Flavobacteriales bacterium]
MKRLYTLTLCLIIFASGFSQIRFTEVNTTTNDITLTNMGPNSEDISSWFFCSLIQYTLLSSTTLVSGDLNLAPGASVTVNWSGGGMNSSMADMCLYLDNSFTSPTSMQDFLQWGSGGNGRESVAVTKGIWTAGEFIDIAGPYTFNGGASDFGLSFWLPMDNSGPCTDLFFSEYIEGSSSNKAIEVYNPTGSAVDLGNYQILRFNNGGTSPSGTFNFPAGAMLADGDVWLSANGSADIALTSIADEDTSNVTFYNGDDAMVLMNLMTGDTLDIIGIVGVDPGSGWPVGSGFTNNQTLVRSSSVQEGTTDWSLSATQWEVFPIDDFTHAGSHTMIPCGASDVFVGFASSTLSVDEDAGILSLGVGLTNNDGNPVDVTVSLGTGGTATDVDDFTHTLPQVINFTGAADEVLNFNVAIVDDADVEGDESIELVLELTTGSAVITTDTLIITINASDMIIPTYPIGDINNVDVDGVADSIGVECKVIGTVYGVNLRPSGLQFTMHDGTGGVGVFFNTGDLGYIVTEGDEIRLIGSISQFSGLTQMNPDSIVLLSQGNALPDPTVITVQDESTESELIRIECVTIDDPADWSPGGSGFNVDVSNANGSYVIRIDSDTEVAGLPAPTGVFTVTGIGGQFDSSPPLDSGYQLLPRYNADINEADPGCVAAPVNNACAGAIDISSLFVIGTNTSDIYSNVGATVDASDPANGWECFGEPDGTGSAPSLENTMWFSFTPDACGIPLLTSAATTDCNGTATDYIDDGDTQMALYSGDCGALVPVACNEDSPNATVGNYFSSLDDIALDPTITYYLMVDGFSLNGTISDGEYCLEVTFDCGFGLDEVRTFDLSAYPNPSEGQFSMDIEGNVQQVQIFNALGQEVAFTAEQLQNKVNIDLTGNEIGIYQVLVTTEKGSAALQYVLTK